MISLTLHGGGKREIEVQFRERKRRSGGGGPCWPLNHRRVRKYIEIGGRGEWVFVCEIDRMRCKKNGGSVWMIGTNETGETEWTE